MAENVFCFVSVAWGEFALLPSSIHPTNHIHSPYPFHFPFLSHCNLAVCVWRKSWIPSASQSAKNFHRRGPCLNLLLTIMKTRWVGLTSPLPSLCFTCLLFTQLWSLLPTTVQLSSVYDFENIIIISWKYEEVEFWVKCFAVTETTVFYELWHIKWHDYLLS